MTEKKRSKAALPGQRKNMFAVPPEQLTLIGLDTKDGPEHPLYDPRVKQPPPEWMIRSVIKHGIRQNISVRKIIVDGKERYEVIYGRKRVRAARAANKRLKEEGSNFLITVPTVLEKQDEDTLFSFMVVENELREDTDVLQKAELASRMRRRGASEKDIADAFGVTVKTAQDWDVINSLCKGVKEAIKKGEIRASAAAALADFTAEEQMKQLDDLKKEAAEAGGKRITIKQARKAAKKVKGHDDLQAPGKRLVKKVIALEAAKETLSDDFIQGARWAIGDLAPTTIAGLVALVREAENNKRAKR